MIDNATYRHYGMSTPKDECIADFTARYGAEPVVCELVISPTLLGGKKWAYWKVGPVPERITMICPACKKEFAPDTHDQKFCDPSCRKLYNNRLYRARHKDAPKKPRKVVRLDPETSTHPCKRCGGPAKYRQVFCNGCKSSPKGAGIAPLTTPRIRNARRHEQELIDRVVAKSLEGGRQGGNDDNNRRLHGRLNGHKIG